MELFACNMMGWDDIKDWDNGYTSLRIPRDGNRLSLQTIFLVIGIIILLGATHNKTSITTSHIIPPCLVSQKTKKKKA